MQDQIASKRDPVFRAAYQAIEEAIASQDKLLLGSMYWKWWFPLFGDAGATCMCHRLCVCAVFAYLQAELEAGCTRVTSNGDSRH